jgi:hypothetical protein
MSNGTIQFSTTKWPQFEKRIESGAKAAEKLGYLRVARFLRRSGTRGALPRRSFILLHKINIMCSKITEEARAEMFPPETMLRQLSRPRAVKLYSSCGRRIVGPRVCGAFFS